MAVVKKANKMKAVEEKRIRALQEREVKRRMGAFRYYAMPWQRAKYGAAIKNKQKVPPPPHSLQLLQTRPRRSHKATEEGAGQG